MTPDDTLSRNGHGEAELARLLLCNVTWGKLKKPCYFGRKNTAVRFFSVFQNTAVFGDARLTVTGLEVSRHGKEITK